jgi:putative endonuclease
MGDTKRRKRLGDAGERLANGRLEAEGYRIIERNWRCEYGELDAVGWHEKCLCFIEVRTRRGNNGATPEESISPTKQRRLGQLVEAYLQAHPQLWEAGGDYPACRVDMVAIQFDPTGRLTRLDVHQNILN